MIILDVYIHRSGVIEQRPKLRSLRDKHSFVEAVPQFGNAATMTEADPIAPSIPERRWLRQAPTMHGVDVWIEA